MFHVPNVPLYTLIQLRLVKLYKFVFVCRTQYTASIFFYTGRVSFVYEKYNDIEHKACARQFSHFARVQVIFGRIESYVHIVECMEYL